MCVLSLDIELQSRFSMKCFFPVCWWVNSTKWNSLYSTSLPQVDPGRLVEVVSQVDPGRLDDVISQVDPGQLDEVISQVDPTWWGYLPGWPRSTWWGYLPGRPRSTWWGYLPGWPRSNLLRSSPRLTQVNLMRLSPRSSYCSETTFVADIYKKLSFFQHSLRYNRIHVIISVDQLTLAVAQPFLCCSKCTLSCTIFKLLDDEKYCDIEILVRGSFVVIGNGNIR